MVRQTRRRIIRIFLSLLYFGIISNALAEKVVIVGAGLSGLTAAYRLQRDMLFCLFQSFLPLSSG